MPAPACSIWSAILPAAPSCWCRSLVVEHDHPTDVWVTIPQQLCVPGRESKIDKRVQENASRTDLRSLRSMWWLLLILTAKNARATSPEPFRSCALCAFYGCFLWLYCKERKEHKELPSYSPSLCSLCILWLFPLGLTAKNHRQHRLLNHDLTLCLCVSWSFSRFCSIYEPASTAAPSFTGRQFHKVEPWAANALCTSASSWSRHSGRAFSSSYAVARTRSPNLCNCSRPAARSQRARMSHAVRIAWARAADRQRTRPPQRPVAEATRRHGVA